MADGSIKPLNEDARELAKRARMLLRRIGDNPLQSGVIAEAVRNETAKAARFEDVDGLLMMAEGANLESATIKSATGPSASAAVAAHDVVQAAQEALAIVADEGGGASNLTDFQFASLEAIVLLTGRPAMRYTDGRVQSPPNDVGDNERWRTFVAIARSKIDRASSSVGQVGQKREGMPAAPIGTAWRLGPDLVVTNRHVAKVFVVDPTLDPSRWKLDPGKPAIVDFNVTDNATTEKRFAVTELVYCAPEETVDMAIFRVASNGVQFPAALSLDFDAESVGRAIPVAGQPQFHGEEIYIIGHPFRETVTSATATVFGAADGFKRCAPGKVMVISEREHAFEHDCSTLGGNSGSCLLTVSGHNVVGLHYGGLEVETNGVGRANVALGLARLGAHRAVEILRSGRIE